MPKVYANSHLTLRDFACIMYENLIFLKGNDGKK